MGSEPRADQITFLGTGTSYGVPMIGCRCAVCRSDSPRNQRLRCSALLESRGTKVMFDVTPDFRTQALRVGLDRLDAVVITHVHADHVMGLDDLRPLSLARDEALPVYALPEACTELRTIFGYVFATEKKRMGLPWLALKEVEPGETFRVGPLEFDTCALPHGRGRTLGIRRGDFAYLTDLKSLPTTAAESLRGINRLALDHLRVEPHPTHLCRAEALDIWKELGRPRTWFIHMGHEVDHEPYDAELPEGTSLAYDGLVVPLI